MKASRFCQEQIIGILKQHESGVSASHLCREHSISSVTFNKWKSKYGGMDVNEAECLRQ
jgi:putative transposase